MRILRAICLSVAMLGAACQTSPDRASERERPAVPETVRIPPLEHRPTPRFQEITYMVSGEGTIHQTDIALVERRENYDVFEVTNHMPHGTSVNLWQGYTGLFHLLVTPVSPQPGARVQRSSLVGEIESWDGGLFPLAEGNQLEVIFTRIDTVQAIATGETREAEETCLSAFRVMEVITEPQEPFEDLEGPFYFLRQTIECENAEEVAYREIIFSTALGCPVEIRNVNAEGNPISYRQLAWIVPLEDNQ